MGYVITRLEPESPSGCVYWTGSVAFLPVDDGAIRMHAGTAFSRHNVLVIENEEQAAGLALWLNTSAALVREAANWQALPLASYVGRAA